MLPFPHFLNDIHGLPNDLARAYAISLLEKTVQESALDGLPNAECGKIVDRTTPLKQANALFNVSLYVNEQKGGDDKNEGDAEGDSSSLGHPLLSGIAFP